MPFKPGTPKPVGSGRTVGTPNKRTVAFYQSILESDFDAAKAILNVHNEALKSLEYCNREERVMYLGIMLKAASEIAQYCYPKLKSIEHKKENQMDGMSIEEKLQVMRKAVAMLELEAMKDQSIEGEVIK